jgi:dihydrofolate synthase/folylpolyglutamate synthase
LESIYLAAGYAVGTFTSPHLWRFNERIRTGGRDIDDATLIDRFARMDSALEDITLTYFESSAVAAMLHFALEQVDVAILEVGMGGRLDAVNALDTDAALIVSIDLDHMDWLGPDRDAIGFEKAGIARRGKPAIVTERQPPQRMLDELSRRAADIRLLGRDFDVENATDGWLLTRRNELPREFPLPAFGGAHQIQNAAAAVAVVDSLQRRLPLDDVDLARGISGARLRGRIEVHSLNGREWLFDVAHNAAAARILRAFVERLPPASRTAAVFGAMRDKQLGVVLGCFADIVREWHLAPVDSERTASVRAMAEFVDSAAADVRCHADIPSATQAASRSEADRIIVFGSFYTAGPALAALGLYSAPLSAG